MKSSCIDKEDLPRRHASVNDNDSDAAGSTRTPIGANQYEQPWEQQKKCIEQTAADIPDKKLNKTGLKSLEEFFLQHSIKPCPFTFLTAVKNKISLSGNSQIYQPVNKPNQFKDKEKMDLIKPLKVPDMKISPKVDYSSRESLLSSEEFSKKIEAIQKDEIAMKSSDRVPNRKLEFSSSSSASMFNYDNVEPMKVPEFVTNKKKDLSRDSSREKENRTKKAKKDDHPDLSAWSMNQRHVSRKEIAHSVISRKLKNDLAATHVSKDKDDTLQKKSKLKNSSLSAIKNDDEKFPKNSNAVTKTKREYKVSDSKSGTSNSDSLYSIDKGKKLHDKILIREGYKAMISVVDDHKFKDDSQISTAKTSDESRFKSHSETRASKQQNKTNLKPIDILSRDSTKKLIERQKSNKIDSKHSSEISEDLITAATSNNSAKISHTSETSKFKHFEKSQMINSRNNDESKYSENLSTTVSSHLNSSNIETKISHDSSLSDKLMDPTRISFREDNYNSNQPEFAGLVTPDVNLMIRSKRRKAYQSREHDGERNDLKSINTKASQEAEDSHLLQLKTEMNLLDSFNESLRHAIDDRIRPSIDHKETDTKKVESDSNEIKEDSSNKSQRPKVVEVQTQTVNDMGTQTENTSLSQTNISNSLIYSFNASEIPHTSINAEDRYESMDRVEDMSMPNRMRAMSEISLHETTSSIKTETGTEISISTRGVTYSFNKHLDLEMAQLIKDEKQRYDKIEMLFKSREKSLNDRTKKLVKLEEQKRALRDTGQDSRVSSVKKKQRALLLKLQQEKDEMNRLKELHKIASQERKLMLQKQRDMFNPEMSTKNILNKLKRSADSHSPRKISGPMKGYDIRSNSSISSLVDSDKSMLDRSNIDFKLNLSDVAFNKDDSVLSKLDLDQSLKHCLQGNDSIDKKLSKLEASKLHKELAASKAKYDAKTRKFEEKMPKNEQLKLKSPQHDFDASLNQSATAIVDPSKSNNNQDNFTQEESISDRSKSQSDAFVEDFSQIWKSQFPGIPPESINLLDHSESLEILQVLQKVSSKKADKECLKRIHQYHAILEAKLNKRKPSRLSKAKLSESLIQNENELQQNSDGSCQYSKGPRDFQQHQYSDEYQNSLLEELDFNDSQSSLQALLRHSNLLKERNHQLLQDLVDERNLANPDSPVQSHRDDEELGKIGNTSARSQLSLTISHQSSNDSDRSYSRSVVIRSQEDHHHHHHHQQHSGLKTSKKLEQILRAREATLVSRRNCVDEWMAWHARLRDEEHRVARMEQAAFKLVSATSHALNHNETTISSDTSDVEGRIELLTQKLADRRVEMARLKKEARKQAKQRLRTLEANLLTQIKKYDVTIHEMRKKLEQKKVKDSEKLAIESKIVGDFKVPEIPIKKIQEIYKNSDLLKSKSDLDVISDRLNKVDGAKVKSSSDVLKLKIPPLYDEERESSEKSYKSKSNSEEVFTQKNIINDVRRSSSQSSNISEDIPSEIQSVKSQSESILTAKTSEAASSRVSEMSKDENKESIIEELVPLDDSSIIFSKKLDNIHINNKELNDDIHTLENDFKELTEMMSNFSKKSDTKNKSSKSRKLSVASDKSTLKDISEALTASGSNEKSHTDSDLQQRIKKIMKDVVPETEELVTSIEELNKKEKSLEIPVELDNTIASEHINKIPEKNATEVPSQKTESLSSVDELIERALDTPTESISSAVDDQQDSIVESFSGSQLIQLKLSKLPGDSIYSHIDDSKSEKIDGAQVDQESFSSKHEKSGSVLESKEKSELQIQTAMDEIPTEIHTSMTQEITENQVSFGENDEIENKSSESKVESSENKSPTLQELCNSISEKLSDKEEDEESDEPPSKRASPIGQEDRDSEISIAKNSISENNWTLSDSFEVHGFKEPNDSKQAHEPEEKLPEVPQPNEQVEQKPTAVTTSYVPQNLISAMDDSHYFMPKGESTNIHDTFVLKLDDSTDTRIGICSAEFNDILEIIERETKLDGADLMAEPVAIIDPLLLSMQADMLSQVMPAANYMEFAPIQTAVITEEPSVIEEIEAQKEAQNNDSIVEDLSNHNSLSDKDADFPQIEIGTKIEIVDAIQTPLVEEDVISKHEDAKDFSEEDRRSSDGEQLDNLIEVAEGQLDTFEKITENKKNEINSTNLKNQMNITTNHTLEVIKDPGYEDISEESLEVSDILDKSGSKTNQRPKKYNNIPEKYVIRSKSDEVLRILDELSVKNRDAQLNDKNNALNKIEEKDEVAKSIAPPTSPDKTEESLAVDSLEEKVKEKLMEIEDKRQSSDEQQNQEDSLKVPSEQSDLDTPTGISDIDVDSPRDQNENSRLDIDALDDDLLSDNSIIKKNEAKTEFRTTPVGVSSEKDIEAMIDKLRASLDQPGLEVAELEAKLLQIENLQIELEIKKLEAEEVEVSYYVREIPNKPPPPYTPPGVVRISGTHASPSPPPLVIPSNIDELVAITERATSFLHDARKRGEDINQLSAPSEICELFGDSISDELFKRDRRVYNSFLFDLCKELVVEMYRPEHETPGPTWTKPSVKSKPVLKLPKSLDELNEYVAKEAATLFGFKTKLQRENMVMRWSRKRRDRVDELLAKEAQAEEKEWTKFHHDELDVKNELTSTIFDSLIMDTVSCIKAAYAKKYKLSKT
ncbi:centrosome-associated protein 350-like [Trichogramma pretiosum]|uniref:centrosome-associated protein 350-like n=1 Tax=Trichogramma pretiosum TaxID=7493 RepID=UPI0006C972E6|nr:centrosome-associated protein 350-like [Trichogramma pretiosum]